MSLEDDMILSSGTNICIREIRYILQQSDCYEIKLNDKSSIIVRGEEKIAGVKNLRGGDKVLVIRNNRTRADQVEILYGPIDENRFLIP